MTVWWLVTWGTYGSWLPGDPRGFRTWRRREYVPPPDGRALGGEPLYDPAAYAERHRRARERLTAPPVCLTLTDRRIACSALVAEIDHLRIVPAILAVAKSHVHLVAQFGEIKIRTVVGRLKAAATRSLRQGALTTAPTWATGCHMKSLYREADFTAGFRYVVEHREEGAVLHRWDSNIEWTFDG
ncbi:MAG TPA: hypothetical protein VEI07_02070 [Planctomycetaceae bacterium]|nr:hypothetical protein [Planctomycetaceae bacterium]